VLNLPDILHSFVVRFHQLIKLRLKLFDG